MRKLKDKYGVVHISLPSFTRVVLCEKNLRLDNYCYMYTDANFMEVHETAQVSCMSCLMTSIRHR